MHNINAYFSRYFYEPPPDMRDNDPHAVDLRSPGERAAGGKRLEFGSPGGDQKVGSSAKHGRK